MKKLYQLSQDVMLLLLFMFMFSCQDEEDQQITETVNKAVADEKFFLSAQDAKEVAVLINAEGVIDKTDVKTALAARSSKPSKKVKESKTLTDTKSRDALHIINYEGGGFTIISGDKRLPAVLAYNEEGNIDLSNYAENPGLNIWITSLQREITALRDSPDSSESELAAGWEPEVTTNSEPPCGLCEPEPTPLITYGPLMTTLWGQGCGYNDFSPSKDGPCGKAPAGCGPVAVAQILRYHRNRLGTVTYNGVPINFSDATMPNSVNNAPGSAPDVARLNRFIGDWIIIDWAGSYAMALPSKIPDFLRIMGFISEIKDIHDGTIQGNIRGGKPVILKGMETGFFGPLNQHIWVVEGYRTHNYGQYWMNWGWYGKDNGWYYISSWKPNSHDRPYSEGMKMITAI